MYNMNLEKQSLTIRTRTNVYNNTLNFNTENIITTNSSTIIFNYINIIIRWLW